MPRRTLNRDITSRKGFLLMEAMLGVAVFGIFVTVIGGSRLVGQEWTVASGNRVRATFFAEEALNATRTIQGTDFSVLTNPGISDGNPHGLVFNLVTNAWSFVGTESLVDLYTTSVVVVKLGNDWVRVTATTTWIQENGLPGTVTLSTELTDWRKEDYIGDWSSVTLEGSYTVTGSLAPLFNRVAIHGNTAYVTSDVSDGGAGLYVFDITSLASPQLVKTINLGYEAHDLAVIGGEAIAMNDTGKSENVSLAYSSHPPARTFGRHLVPIAAAQNPDDPPPPPPPPPPPNSCRCSEPPPGPTATCGPDENHVFRATCQGSRAAGRCPEESYIAGENGDAGPDPFCDSLGAFVGCSWDVVELCMPTSGGDACTPDDCFPNPYPFDACPASETDNREATCNISGNGDGSCVWYVSGQCGEPPPPPTPPPPLPDKPYLIVLVEDPAKEIQIFDVSTPENPVLINVKNLLGSGKAYALATIPGTPDFLVGMKEVVFYAQQDDHLFSYSSSTKIASKSFPSSPVASEASETVLASLRERLVPIAAAQDGGFCEAGLCWGCLATDCASSGPMPEPALSCGPTETHEFSVACEFGGISCGWVATEVCTETPPPPPSSSSSSSSSTSESRDPAHQDIMYFRLSTYDVSLQNFYLAGEGVRDISIQGDSAFIATMDSDLVVAYLPGIHERGRNLPGGIRLSGPSQPNILSTIAANRKVLLGTENGASVDELHRYALVNSFPGELPEEPAEATREIGANVLEMSADPVGCYAFVVSDAANKTIDIFDLDGVALPLLTQYNPPGTAGRGRGGIYDAVKDRMFLLTSKGFLILKATNPRGSCGN